MAQVKTGRSAGDVLRAIAAVLALIVLVIGVPLALAALIGWPGPSSAPSMDMLTDEISADAFLKVLAVLVWVAWAQFTACVLVEAAGAFSGVGIPRRVPGAGPSQILARQLVGAVLLLTSAAASLTPGLSQLGPGGEGPGPGSSQVVASAQRIPGVAAVSASPDGGGKKIEGEPVTKEELRRVEAAEAAAGEAASEAAPTTFYRIQPPEGRHHDTLWGVAERHLGDGLRYREVYQLNKDRVQPDGSRLTEASLIRPGWILEMPADAQGGELVELPGDMAELDRDEADAYERYRDTGDPAPPAPAPDVPAESEEPEEPEEPEEDGPGRPLIPGGPNGLNDLPSGLPDGGSGGSGTPGGSGDSDGRGDGADAAPEAAHAAGEDEGFGLSEALVGAPLLAAGLLLALGRTRRNALWQSAAGTLGRGVGDGLGPGGPEAAAARDALLVGAAPRAVAFLDRALRHLAAALGADGKPLPPVYAAWLGESTLHLQLAAPAGRPPAPWGTGADETYWTVYENDVPDGETTAEAPYPGLASLGTREGLRLLLNLEAVPGAVAVTGRARQRDAVLASIAAELATSGWSDRMTVTLVGFGEDLIPLAPTRVRHVEDVAGLLEVMENETRLRLGRAGLAPHLVLVGRPPTPEEADRLGALAAVSAQVGIGYLVSSDRPGLPGTAWQFEVTDDGLLKEPMMGLELTAQLLPAAARAAVVELFADLTRGREGAPSGAGEPPETGAPEVYVRLMGGYEITGLPEPEAERAERLREALALLLLHREGVHPRVLGAALWPRGVTDDVREALTGRLREWLGPRLVTAPGGRLTLARSVASDWDLLISLHHGTVVRGGRLPARERLRRLGEALELARGPLLADARYGWLAHEIVDAQYPLVVTELALTLAVELRGAGEAQQAYTAIRGALASAPGDERLWNELLRAAHATGRAEWLSGAASWLLTHHAHLFGPTQ
ncbi:bacterial transcriptional activator domain-containing protein, partial [Streptomyces sp. SBT349]|uniref:bacterial transcriptional activator domain-containing protein n=1 Tax=Streptomyces sp. SBT349 TaxID=1580539 RepID=UPI00066AFDF1